MARLKKLTLQELDGEYDVTFSSDVVLPEGFFEHMAATVFIQSGSLTGEDIGGSKWKADLSIVENCVSFNACVDPAEAPDDTFLYDVNGQPTRQAQSYTGLLDVILVENKFKIYGSVHHGSIVITINLTRKQNGL